MNNKQPKYPLETFHMLHDQLHEECAVDGTFLGQDRFNQNGNTKEFIFIILDALEQMFINNTEYMNKFNHQKDELSNGRI